MNLQIKHAGMMFPQGEIVPANAFKADQIDRLIELGAIEEVDAAPTMEPPVADTQLLNDDELAAENRRLKDKLGILPTEVAALKVRIKFQRDTIQELEAERDLLKEESAAKSKIIADLQQQLSKVIEAHKAT